MLVHSLDETLRVILPHIPPALIPRDQHDPMLALSQALPYADIVAFEARLTADDPQVDLAFCAVQATPEHRFFADYVAQQAQVYGAAWERLQTFLHDPSYENVSHLWLEYDIPAGDPPVPGLFLAVPPDAAVTARFKY
ncbi:MAG: hypothetical protein ACLFTK_17505 [Anaerolineales bacterium]